MIVTCQEMKHLEESAFAKGVAAETLMDEAGAQIASAVQQFVPEPGTCLVYVGKGHNGGDALVAARHLAAMGWSIQLEEVFPRESLAPLTAKKLNALLSELAVTAAPALKGSRGPFIALDGLLGIGAKPGLRDPILSAVKQMNTMRTACGVITLAIDIPTGLDGDTGEHDPEAVVADFTLTIGFAKRGLLADAAPDHVGRIVVLPLAELKAEEQQESVSTNRSLNSLMPPRPFNTHKGDCGRVGIVAGSRGFTGAAIMAANAAVRAGAGLVSLFVTPDIYRLVAASVMPEVMTVSLDCYLDVLDKPLDSIAIGPGLGKEDGDDILAVVERFPGPMVVDAEALNLLSSDPSRLNRVVGPRLLTPHPGEMRRLFPQSSSLSRRDAVVEFLALYPGAPLTLLLKGARTLVGQRGEPSGVRLSYNSTGNPGMASGGMGDVLTGTCAALLGQGQQPFDAARLGAWLCGRSAEVAVSHGGRSHESLCATDLLEFFGAAFKELRSGGW
jgi:NAD(P)H-hydrate epimerase